MLELALQIMIKKITETDDKNLENFNNICEECKKKDRSVKQNLIINGYKYCNSCKTSKTLFPI